MYRRRLFLGLLIFFGLTASPAAADEAGTVWAKAGADGAVMTREMAACTREASTIWTSANTPGATSMANLIATVLVSGTVTPKVQVEYIRSCMVGRGFSAVTLSATETVDQNRQKTPEATAGWADRIYGDPAFPGRLAASQPIKIVPQLPQVVEEPFAYGSIRLDLSAIQVNAGAVTNGMNVMTGSVTHRFTGRTSTDVRFSKVSQFIMPAGTIVHAVVSGGGEGSNRTYWCGLITMGSMFKSEQNLCAWIDDTGYIFVYGLGNPSLMIRPDFGNLLAKGAGVPFTVVPSSTDLLGSFPFRFSVNRVGPFAVSVAADVMTNGGAERIWSADVLFDDDGVAVVPFWTHRLIFKRSDAGVSVSYTADGDGKGWDDAVVGAVR